ncbi:MAG: hypothetical protein GY707_16340 [Desulfobacteraceae bacterium]|nr:hypothetical protein [Desulfobacteraceae bacterium]
MNPDLPKSSIDPPRYVKDISGYSTIQYLPDIPENRYATIKLAKLTSPEMRKKAYRAMSTPLISHIPTAYTMHLREMIKEERQFLGYKN